MIAERSTLVAITFQAGHLEEMLGELVDVRVGSCWSSMRRSYVISKDLETER